MAVIVKKLENIYFLDLARINQFEIVWPNPTSQSSQVNDWWATAIWSAALLKMFYLHQATS